MSKMLDNITILNKISSNVTEHLRCDRSNHILCLPKSGKSSFVYNIIDIIP